MARLGRSFAFPPKRLRAPQAVAGTTYSDTPSGGIRLGGTTGGTDALTVLLIHADGADASTSFTDSSPSNHTITAHGDAQVDTAQAQFGQAALFDGTGDYLSTPDHTDFEFGTGDFTIDFWLRPTNVTPGQILIAKRITDDFTPFAIYLQGGVISFYASSNGSSWDVALAQSLGTLSNGTWYHVAVARSGNTFYGFLTGTQAFTFTSSLGLFDNAQPLTIGGDPAGNFFNGWIDELRISKGIARWTSNFTPPSAPYTVGATKTFAQTPSAGIRLGGSVSVARDFSKSVSAGLVLNGSRSVTRTLSLARTAGIVLGGSAAVTRTLAKAPSGGIVLGGSAVVARDLSKTVSAGLRLGGSVASARVLSFTRTSGIVLGGSATSALFHGYTSTPSGGLVLSGSASSSKTYGPRFPVTSVLENFTGIGAGVALPTFDSDWMTGAVGGALVGSGANSIKDNSATGRAVYGPVTAADCEAYLTVGTWDATGVVYLYARWDDATQSGYGVRIRKGTPHIRIERVDAGTEVSLITSTSLTPADGDRFGIRVYGTGATVTIEAWYAPGGVWQTTPILTYNDSNALRKTNAGKLAIETDSGAPGVFRLDDFGGGNVVGAQLGGIVLGGTTVVARIFAKSVSAGLRLGGSTVSTRVLSLARTAGIVLNGSATSSLFRVYSAAPSGGIRLGGSVATTRTLAKAPSGGIRLGGSTVVVRTLARSVSAGLRLGGSLIDTRVLALARTAGVVLNGSATSSIARAYSFAPTGGIRLGGSAVVTRAFTKAPSAGLVLGGAATVARDLSKSVSAGLRLGGSVASTRVLALARSGGLVLDGSAESARALSHARSGGIRLGGSATSALVVGAVVTLRVRLLSAGVEVASWSHNLGGTEARVSWAELSLPLSPKLAPEGGIVLGGSAAQTKAYTASRPGGIVLNGSRSQSVTKLSTRSGGLVLNGSRATVVARVLARAGGIVLRGSAAQVKRYASTRSGGIVLGGTTRIGLRVEITQRALTLTSSIRKQSAKQTTATGLSLSDATATRRDRKLASVGLTFGDSLHRAATPFVRSVAASGLSITDSVRSIRTRRAADALAISASLATKRTRRVADTGLALGDSLAATNRTRRIAATGLTLGDSIKAALRPARWITVAGLKLADSIRSARTHRAADIVTVADSLRRAATRRVTDAGLTFGAALRANRTRRVGDAGLTVGDSLTTTRRRTEATSSVGLTLSATLARQVQRGVSDRAITIGDAVTRPPKLTLRTTADVGLAIGDSLDYLYAPAFGDPGLRLREKLELHVGRVVLDAGMSFGEALTQGGFRYLVEPLRVEVSRDGAYVEVMDKSGLVEVSRVAANVDIADHAATIELVEVADTTEVEYELVEA